MSSQFKCIALLVATVVTGCGSTPSPQRGTDQEKYDHQGSCYGDGCAVMAGTMLLIGAVMGPTTRAERNDNAAKIYGRCEILNEHDTAKPALLPCSRVELTLRKHDSATTRTERTAWVDGFDFEIPAVEGGPYTLEAYSEQYEARAAMDTVKVGQFIRIQIVRPRLPERSRRPADIKLKEPRRDSEQNI